MSFRRIISLLVIARLVQRLIGAGRGRRTTTRREPGPAKARPEPARTGSDADPQS